MTTGPANSPTSGTFAALCRVAGWAALASSVVAAIGVVFILLLYAGMLTGATALLPFGPANDVCVIVQYLLALPVALALDRILRRHAPTASRLATCAAIVGIVGVTVFQSLLLAGALSFERQILPASLSVLLMGLWIVVAGGVGQRSGELPASRASIVAAALYFGYPVWAWRVGRLLLGRGDGAPFPRLQK